MQRQHGRAWPSLAVILGHYVELGTLNQIDEGMQCSYTVCTFRLYTIGLVTAPKAYKCRNCQNQGVNDHPAEKSLLSANRV